MTLVCGAHLEPCCNSPGPLHTVFTVLQVSHQTPEVKTSKPLNIMATHYISHHMSACHEALLDSGLPGLVTVPPRHMFGEEGHGLLDDAHWENILIVVISLGEMRGGKVWGLAWDTHLVHATCRVRVRVRD